LTAPKPSCGLGNLGIGQEFVVPSREYDPFIPNTQARYGLAIQPICNKDQSPYALTMLFGDRLKQARTSKGWSQEKLGEGLGMEGTNVTKQTVYGWEQNNHSPTARQLALICDRLGCGADWLLFGRQAQDLKSLNGLEAQLVFMYRLVGEQAKDQLLNLASKLLEIQQTIPQQDCKTGNVFDESNTFDGATVKSSQASQDEIFNLGSFDNSKTKSSPNVRHTNKRLRK
jgi:transcriptional regulator with XRE-family HTH domain